MAPSPYAMGHSGFTGPYHVGPVGIPYSTTGTASTASSGGTILVTAATTGTWRLGEPHLEFPAHVIKIVETKSPPPTVHSVHLATIATPLDGAVAFVAFGGLLTASTATVWHNVRRWSRRRRE